MTIIKGCYQKISLIIFIIHVLYFIKHTVVRFKNTVQNLFIQTYEIYLLFNKNYFLFRLANTTFQNFYFLINLTLELNLISDITNIQGLLTLD